MPAAKKKIGVFCPQCGTEHPDKYEAKLCCDVRGEGETEEEQLRRLFADEIAEATQEAEATYEERKQVKARTIGGILVPEYTDERKQELFELFNIGDEWHIEGRGLDWYRKKRMIVVKVDNPLTYDGVCAAVIFHDKYEIDMDNIVSTHCFPFKGINLHVALGEMNKVRDKEAV